MSEEKIAPFDKLSQEYDQWFWAKNFKINSRPHVRLAV